MPLLNALAADAPELAEWRRDLHRHPELGYREARTAGVVAEKLRAFGFDEVHEGIGRTGVVGVLHGRTGKGGEADAVMLRADMDALPIEEANGFKHRSANEGVMHACGHDGHTTMLLGAARQLARNRAFEGTAYFCFQPAEEAGAGAEAMMKDGLFDRFPCRAIYGMHNMPGLAVGRFATRPGPVLAACDEFTITLEGLGGHAAHPNDTRDPIVAQAALVSALQTIPSRIVDPLAPVVVSVTQVHAGSAMNVIPQEAVLHGTVRTFDEGVYEETYDAIRRILDGIGEAFGVTPHLEGNKTYYPPTINDADETAFALDVASEVMGEAADGELPMSMGAEDFAFYAREKPACFIMCGNGDSALLHHPRYDFDDEANAWGATFWTRLVERALPGG